MDWKYLPCVKQSLINRESSRSSILGGLYDDVKADIDSVCESARIGELLGYGNNSGEAGVEKKFIKTVVAHFDVTEQNYILVNRAAKQKIDEYTACSQKVYMSVGGFYAANASLGIDLFLLVPASGENPGRFN